MNSFFTENKLIASVVVIGIIFLLRWLVIRHLQRRQTSEDELPRKWINSVKNTANLLIGISLIIIWISELRLIALSIATFIVALVIAAREFIQSFLGSLYQTGTRSFSIGDWIEVGSHCGEVVSSDWLSTSLLEVDLQTPGYTGKTLVIPNNHFISTPIKNLNFMRRYVTHSFAIIRDAEKVNVTLAKAYILEKLQEYCAPFQDTAARYNSFIEIRLGVSIPGPEPSVRITTNNMAKNVFTVSFFCPTEKAVKIEQKITADFMAYWYDALDKGKEKKRSEADTEVPVNTVKDVSRGTTV